MSMRITVCCAPTYSYGSVQVYYVCLDVHFETDYVILNNRKKIISDN